MNIAIELLKDKNWFDVATNIIAISSLVCALTPKPSRNTRLAKVYKVVEILALNILRARK
jgi:hypothetical protein